MSEKLITNPENQETSEAIEEAIGALGSAFHEDWRKSRLKEDGSYEPRVKETRDAAWIEANGSNQVDIANTNYDQLPEDWKAENKAAADVVVRIMLDRAGVIDLSDPSARSELGEIVHRAWLSRNEWAKGGDLDKPFDELPENEQAKDINQLVIAQQVLSVK